MNYEKDNNQFSRIVPFLMDNDFIVPVKKGTINEVRKIRIT